MCGLPRMKEKHHRGLTLGAQGSQETGTMALPWHLLPCRGCSLVISTEAGRAQHLQCHSRGFGGLGGRRAAGPTAGGFPTLLHGIAT